LRDGASLLHRVRGPDCAAALQQLDFCFFSSKEKKKKNQKHKRKMKNL